MKAAVGRPTKKTEELVSKLHYAFSIGATAEEACFYADISRDTFYDWAKKDTAFSDRCKELQLNPIFKAREAVFNGFKRDPKLALSYLERKLKKEFSLRTETDLTTNGKDIVIPILGSASVNTSDEIKDQT